MPDLFIYVYPYQAVGNQRTQLIFRASRPWFGNSLRWRDGLDLADPGADLFDVPGRKFITWVYWFPKMGYPHGQHPQFQWIQVAPFLDKAIWKQGTYWHSPRLYGNMYVQYFPFLNSIPNQKSGQEFFLNAVVNLNKGTWNDVIWSWSKCSFLRPWLSLTLCTKASWGLIQEPTSLLGEPAFWALLRVSSIPSGFRKGLWRWVIVLVSAKLWLLTLVLEPRA